MEAKNDPSYAVRWPGALLVTAGVLQLCFTITSNVLVLIFMPQIEEFLQEIDPGYASSFASDPFSPLNLVMTGLTLAISVLALVGGLQMMRLRSWKLAFAGAIGVLIPCYGPCCGLAIPVGVWAIVVLMRDEVRKAMSERSPEQR